MYICFQILPVSVFEKTQLSCAFQGKEFTTEQADDAELLNLFTF